MPHEIESEVVESLPASAASLTRYTTVLTAARPITHPARNDGPFALARSENRIRMMAMIGTGLMAMPTANGRTSLIP